MFPPPLLFFMYVSKSIDFFSLLCYLFFNMNREIDESTHQSRKIGSKKSFMCIFYIIHEPEIYRRKKKHFFDVQNFWMFWNFNFLFLVFIWCCIIVGRLISLCYNLMCFVVGMFLDNRNFIPHHPHWEFTTPLSLLE